MSQQMTESLKVFVVLEKGHSYRANPVAFRQTHFQFVPIVAPDFTFISKREKEPFTNDIMEIAIQP